MGLQDGLSNTAIINPDDMEFLESNNYLQLGTVSANTMNEIDGTSNNQYVSASHDGQITLFRDDIPSQGNNYLQLESLPDANTNVIEGADSEQLMSAAIQLQVRI